MKYLSWDEKTISDFTPNNLRELYNTGYVFTRLGKGVMQKTRSVRIDLKQFSLSSENRRIQKKVGSLETSSLTLPLANYDWHIGKLAKDFYETKFGPHIMSAQKVKEMLTDEMKSNFNELLVYKNGFAICFRGSDFLHYSYPFYDLSEAPADMGLGMMINAILFAQNEGLSHIYLGSLQRPGDTYKLQFAGLEWFDGEKWQSDLDEVKKILQQPLGKS